MFGIKIEGRLGNQMFQYAFARALHERLGADFYIDGYKYFFVNRYFILDRYFPISKKASFGNLLKKATAQLALRQPDIIQDQWTSPEEFMGSNTRDNFFYKGFFQSEEYFHNVKPIIEKEFSVRKKLRVNISDFTGTNNRETIVLHIRRGDYINWGSEDLGYNLSLPDSYYHRCLASLQTDNKNILFLSDDINYVKQAFPMPNAFYSENNTEITDLQLLMQGDYLILSNSSFSWWGAFLNKRAKKVLAPQYWLGFKINKEWPNGVISKNWQSIPVL